MSFSYFYKWLFGAEMFSRISRNAPQALKQLVVVQSVEGYECFTNKLTK